MYENIIKTYKKSDKKKKIGKDLELEDRIDKIQRSECYITVKDHKEDFPRILSCPLINSTKLDIRKLSKTILEKINSNVFSFV